MGEGKNRSLRPQFNRRGMVMRFKLGIFKLTEKFPSTTSLNPLIKIWWTNWGRISRQH